MTAFILLLAAASPWDAPRNLVFGEGSSWVVWNTKAVSSTPIALPAGFLVGDVAAARDGQTFFLIAKPPGESKQSVFRWVPSSPNAPVELTKTRGYYGFITLSADEKFVHFSHHPTGGLPGHHPDKSFGQLYRMKTDGSALEQLTNSDGCKLASCPLAGQKMMFLHSTCHGGAEIQTLDGTKELGLSTAGRFNGMSVAPDGESALLTATGLNGVRIIEWTRKTGETRLLVEGNFDGDPRPQYGRTRDEVLAWNNGVVRVGAAAPHLEVSKAGGAR